MYSSIKMVQVSPKRGTCISIGVGDVWRGVLKNMLKRNCFWQVIPVFHLCSVLKFSFYMILFRKWEAIQRKVLSNAMVVCRHDEYYKRGMQMTAMWGSDIKQQVVKVYL